MNQRKVRITLVRCMECGRNGLCLDGRDDTGGLRLTAHTCSGAFNNLESFDCELSADDLRKADRSEKRRVAT